MFRQRQILLSLLIPFSIATSPEAGAQGQDTVAELDALWAEVSRTVAEGDFDAYAATYHPDAVLVSSAATVPITQALANWEPGFAETRQGTTQPRVDFRFTRRANDSTTAHETGIFRFASGEAVQYVHFEALLVKRDGQWLMLMEYQKGPATEADWNSAG